MIHEKYVSNLSEIDKFILDNPNIRIINIQLLYGLGANGWANYIFFYEEN